MKNNSPAFLTYPVEISNLPDMSVHHILATVHFAPETGGISSYLRGLWENLPIDRSVLTSDKQAVPCSNQQHTKIRHVNLPCGTSALSHYLRLLLWIPVLLKTAITKNKPVLHCGQVFGTGFAGAVTNVLFKTPFIVYVYGAEIKVCEKRPVRKKILKWIIARSALVVTISNYTKGLLLSFNCPEEKIFLLPPGVTPKNDIRQETELKWTKRFNENKRIILSVSRLVKRKGIQTVLKALPNIINKYPDTLYLIAGSGQYKDNLKKLVRDKNISDHVVFLGRLPDEDLRVLYKLCEIFILVPHEETETGDIEGFGIVYLEANAFGKPVIASASGGIPDAVSDMKSGLMVPPENPAATANAIITLLSDKELGKRLGHYGRSRVLSEFNWKKPAEQFENKLAELRLL